MRFLGLLRSAILEQSSGNVKPGVEELFKNNQELASIGTPEDYSKYLDTIFPQSKVKDIVYHNTPKSFDTFKKGNIYFTADKTYLKNYGKSKIAVLNIINPKKNITNISGQNLNRDALQKAGFDGVYITRQDLYNDMNQNRTVRHTDDPNIHIDIKPDGSFVKINTKNMTITPSSKEEYDKAYPKNREQENPDTKSEIAVFEPDQIHILGSKEDIEGFRKYMNK